MTEQTHELTVQFLAWVASGPRTYADAMDAWRSSCPRLTIWEDALADGFITIEPNGTREQARIRLSERGTAVLQSGAAGMKSK